MDKNVEYWINIAKYDFDTAKAMMETGRYLYVGFMCHQTAEKALKAVIAKNGMFPPKVHNLIRLCELANLDLEEVKLNFLSELNPLNIQSRYPSETSQINSYLTPAKCQEIISKTEDFLVWIESVL